MRLVSCVLILYILTIINTLSLCQETVTDAPITRARTYYEDGVPDVSDILLPVEVSVEENSYNNQEDDEVNRVPLSYDLLTLEEELYDKKHHPPDHRFKLISLDNLVHLNPALQVALWIFIGALAKTGFHVTPKISLICPESCLLIVVGVVIGLLLFYCGLTNVGPLTPNVFFLYMLPPIVLDAGYFMPNRPFFDNLVTILMFAVVGTVFNAMSVGASLWAVGLTGLYGVEMPLLDTLLFSSIACAVDPIAVLAVFEEIHVNEVLYILVFGESLLNDAVTVVLYHMFEGYAEMGPQNIITVDYLAGVASFFVVAVGGTLVGIIWGLLAAFVSRFTHHVRVIEPLFVFVMSYLSYVSAELFHFSGILALTFCGITMKNYVEENISYKSHVTVKYAMKMLASSSETIIFLFLGVSTVNDNHEWNTWFVVMTIFFCTVYRTIGVIILTAIANRFRLHRIDRVEQFILAYGGLRGAVAFALVLIVSDRIIPTKNMMVTTIIALVFFTVFIQGMTIGPLVRILNVPTKNKIKMSMNERILTRSMDHLMAAIEDIVGQTMGNYHLRDKFKYYNNKYLRPVLTREHANAEPKIFETYSKLNVADAMNLVKQNSNLLPGATGNDLGVSLSSLFRTYTQANLEKSPSVEKGAKAGLDIPRNNSSFLNVDIAELEYSPSNKDLADAELHHILSDAMFKPMKKRYSGRRNSVYDRASSQTPDPLTQHSRLQYRHLMDERIPHRRLSHAYNHAQKSAEPAPNYNTASNSERSLGSNSSDGNNTRGLITGRRKHTKPPPKLRFSVADDTSSEWTEQTSLPTQPAEPLSTYSSLLDVSSGLEDDGIVFTAGTVSPQQEKNQKDNSSESDNEDSSLPNVIPKTLTELTLPWKRDVETRGSPENLEPTFVLRQEAFPYWIENSEYLVHGSPTNTLLSRLGNNSKRIRAPAVFDIFDQSGAALPRPRRNSEDSICTLENGNSKAVDVDSKVANDDVVIEIKGSSRSPSVTMPDEDYSDDDCFENQGTRL
ncbi:Na(+)/H(+) exchanger beta-like [Uloborus diversus]|uniref:Na(+)/H(+) exchanger beta-like n=1 Tax=Uloborus diversus TaxID=327109 RepID=UPI00240998D0|nr:Na(+)/H(+) exchanger beta-like [Uloborus diversus]